jgi:hypothetical protein
MVKPVSLTPELVNFCQGGVGIAIATTDGDGWPTGGPALGAQFDAKDGSVRLILSRESNVPVLEAIAAGRGIAATFAQPTTHKSIQLKAASARTGPAREGDQQYAAAQRAAFCAELVAVGYPEHFAGAYCAFETEGLLSLTFTPTEAFDQTPGPEAGNVLKP